MSRGAASRSSGVICRICRAGRFCGGSGISGLASAQMLSGYGTAVKLRWPRATGLPEQLQHKLNLSRSRGGAGHRPSRRRNNSSGAGGRTRRKGNEVRRVEISAIQQVEELCAKLEIDSFGQLRVLQSREIPGCQAGTNQRVSAQIAIKPAGAWRADEGISIEGISIVESFGPGISGTK